MFRWFERFRKPKEPTVAEYKIGVLQVRSPVLLLAEPMYMFSAIRVSGVPVGPLPVNVTVVQYPEGGQLVANLTMVLNEGRAGECRTLGKIGVDSAKIVVLDELTYREHWQDVGPERFGVCKGPRSHEAVAKLIGNKFGLRSKPIDPFTTRFDQPISEELENEITAYLETIPEYAGCTILYFRIDTGDTFSRILKAGSEREAGSLILDKASGANLVYTHSGCGDGEYAVEGWYDGKILRGVCINFLGPEHEKLLEAFPMLRTGGPV